MVLGLCAGGWLRVSISAFGLVVSSSASLGGPSMSFVDN